MEIDLDKMMSEGCDYSGFLPQRELSIRMNQLLSDILKDGTTTDLQGLSDAVTSLAERPGLQAHREDCHSSMRNTRVNENPTEELRNELIRLGCDPNAKNEWDLSYQLLKDNAPRRTAETRGGEAR